MRVVLKGAKRCPRKNLVSGVAMAMPFFRSYFPFLLPTALFRVKVHRDVSLIFLSDEAVVEWSISLGKYLPKNQSLTYRDRDPGMMKIHLAECERAVYPPWACENFPSYL